MEKIKVAFKPLKTTGDILCHAKNPIGHDQQSGIMYSILCKHCGAVYIGKTGRPFEKNITKNVM